MSWIADCDTHGREFPSCVHVTKTTNGTVHGATYVPIEDGRALRDENAKLRDRVDAAHMSRLLTENENEKLRELCADMWHLLYDWLFKNHEVPWKELEAVHDRVSELGVEVDG